MAPSEADRLAAIAEVDAMVSDLLDIGFRRFLLPRDLVTEATQAMTKVADALRTPAERLERAELELAGFERDLAEDPLLKSLSDEVIAQGLAVRRQRVDEARRASLEP